MQNVQPSKRLRNLIAAVAVLSLAACAGSPIVAVKRPGADTQVPDQTLSYALAYANNARDAYQQAINDEVKASNQLSLGLIGLGGITAGLAAFGAHKDALIGAGLLGGTAYALGNWNLSKQRLLVYQAGIGGINCSVRAVTPLYISPENLKALGAALAILESHTVPVAASIERTRNASKDLAADDANKRLAEQLVAESSARLEQARTAVVSGRQFMTAATRAGPELVGAVDRIRDLVDKAVLDTIPDLSAVPKVVGSLAGLAGSFAPGAGVDTSISGALAAYGTRAQAAELKAQAMPQELADAIAELKLRSSALNSALITVQAQLAGYDTAANTSRLADCGVTGVDTALRVSATRVQLNAGTDMSVRVVVTGGTKPYSGTLLRAPADGLSLNTPLAFDSTFEIVAKKSLAAGGPYTLLITDASSPPKQASVEIAVGAAASSGGNGDGKGAPADTKMSEQSVLDMIKKAGTITDASKNVYTVVQDASKTLFNPATGDIVVTVACKTKPASPATSAELKTALYNALPNEPAVKFAKDTNLIVIFKSDDADCLKAGDTTPQSALLSKPGDQQLRALPANQIRTIQRSLCMPAEDIKAGVWGPHSREALRRFRTRRAAVGTGSLDSLTRQEFAALFAADAREVAARCQQ